MIRTITDAALRLAFLVAFIAAALFLASIHGGCATVPDRAGADSTRVETIRNHYSQVAKVSGESVTFRQVPELRFTGRTATAQQIRAWLRDEGIVVQAMFADGEYAQLEAGSARDTALWLKRALWDIGYQYLSGKRDCDNFARIFRTFPDFFAGDSPGEAQAGVFGIYAKMERPFAGVTDGYHALCVAWTDEGIVVFEPQGLDLTYQLLTAWANKGGISHGLAD